MHWSASSHSLACLLLCGTVMTTLWQTSLALWELWDHRDNSPQFLFFDPTVTVPPPRYIPGSAHPAARIQCLCQLSWAEAWMPHVSVDCSWWQGRFSGLRGASASPAAAIVMQWETEQRAGVLKSRQCWVCSPSSSTSWSCTSWQRSLCAQTLKHYFCDKHQVQTLQCANNLFWTWTRKNKVSSIYLFTFLCVPQFMEYEWPVTGLLAKIIFNFS